MISAYYDTYSGTFISDVRSSIINVSDVRDLQVTVHIDKSIDMFKDWERSYWNKVCLILLLKDNSYISFKPNSVDDGGIDISITYTLYGVSVYGYISLYIDIPSYGPERPILNVYADNTGELYRVPDASLSGTHFIRFNVPANIVEDIDMFASISLYNQNGDVIYKYERPVEFLDDIMGIVSLPVPDVDITAYVDQDLYITMDYDRIIDSQTHLVPMIVKIVN